MTTHTDQSRAEFEHNQRVAATQAVSNELQRLGIHLSWPTVTGLVDLVRATAEQSSGVELPEPELYSFDEQASIVTGDERKFTRTTYTKFKPDEPHTRWYTEQQVRALISSYRGRIIESYVPFALLGAINEAMGGNEWQGDANSGELVEPACHAIASLAGVKDSLTVARRGREETQNLPEARMDKGPDRGREVLPEGYCRKHEGCECAPEAMAGCVTFQPCDLAVAPAAPKACWCTTCRPITLKDMRFVVCPKCGNKRCPRAHNHQLDCTNSNAPGQPGSSWEHVKPVQWCNSCGEGVTTFCRGKTDNCPRGLPLPGKEQT